MSKEKIFFALKAAVLAATGGTSISDRTLNAYADHLTGVITETDEAKIAEAVKPYATLLKVAEGNIDNVTATAVKAKEEALKAEYEKQIAELKKTITPPPAPPKPDDIEAKMKAFFETNYGETLKKQEQLEKELADYKAKEEGNKRAASILAKAKELGISQARIEEGFAIALDADEIAIGTYLAKVAKNDVARSLESEKTVYLCGRKQPLTKSTSLLFAKSQLTSYTMPIVCYYMPETDTYEIVDGFHRYSILLKHRDIYKRENGMMPVVVIEKDISNRMASTIRHNRARGSHDIELMSNIVSELVESGMSDAWIMRNIGMDADELLRLKQITGLAALFRDYEFSEAST